MGKLVAWRQRKEKEGMVREEGKSWAKVDKEPSLNRCLLSYEYIQSSRCVCI